MASKNTRASYCVLLASASALTLIASSAYAGDVRGVATDAATGSRLQGASLRIEQNGRTAVSDNSGAFAFTGLPAGEYTLTANVVGYDPITQTVRVEDAGAVQADLALNAEGGVEAVVISGRRAAEAEALQVKRSATVVVDAVSADDVGKLPDNNAADAVQRLPGVTVTIDQGEGRYVVVRGLDSNLINVSVNNQIFPGPEGGARRVALDTFPADIIARLEVIKALTPDLDANAVGGTVNIVTANPFDTPRGFLRANARAGISDLGAHSNYAANLSAGALFGPDKQFGYVFAASYSHREFESDNYEATGWRSVNGQILPATRVMRDYQILRERAGAVANFEWRPTDDLRVYLNNVYTRYADDEQRDSTTFEYATGTLSNQTATGGSYSQGRATVELRDREVIQTLLNHTLGMALDAGQFHIDWNATFAQADEDTPKRIDWEFRSAAGAFPNTYDVSRPFLRIDAPNQFDATRYPFRRVRSRTDVVEEQTDAYSFDLRYDFADRPGYLKFGARHVSRDKSWDRTNSDYGTVTSGTFTLADVSKPGTPNHLGAMYDLAPVIDRAKIQDYFSRNRARFAVDAASTLSNSLVTDFDATEKVTAAYGMGEFTVAGLVLTGGVRVEKTEATYQSYDVQRRAGVITGFPIRTGRTEYDHTLPDIIARYNIGDSLVIRAGWTNTIGRPNYTDIVPRRDFDATDAGSPGLFTGAYSEGNPDLKPYESENLDLSVEYYLKPAGIISLGVFHKDIENPIYGRTINLTNVAFEGRQYTRLDVSRPENALSGELTGVEVNYQQQFTFLPALFSGFGLSANYTYVDSSTTVFGRADELPFFRQSDKLGNVSLYYEGGGFLARVAVAYRSPYLEALVSPGFDVYVGERTQVDFKLSYAVNENLSLTADVLNINSSPLRLYSGEPSRIYQEERYGPSASIGISAKF